MWATAAATRVPQTFPCVPLSKRFRPRLILPASRPKTRWRACPMKVMWCPAKRPHVIWTCFIPGPFKVLRLPIWLAQLRPLPLTLTAVLPIAKALRCRRSNRIFSARTPMVLEAAMPALGTPCRSHPLQVLARTCSAITGSVRSDVRWIWRPLQRWGGMRRSDH